MKLELANVGLFMNRYYRSISSLLLFTLLGSLFAITETRNWIHGQLLNNKMYVRVYEAVLDKPPKVVVTEIIKVYQPSKEELVITKYILAQNTKMSTEIAQLISRFIVESSQKHKIPSELIVGIIEQESVFNPSAATAIPSKPGDFARGLMQIYQGEDITVDRDRAYDLQYNLDTGCSILNKKLELANGNLDKALANYSGRANGYSLLVLQNVGRLTLFKWRNVDETDKVAITE